MDEYRKSHQIWLDLSTGKQTSKGLEAQVFSPFRESLILGDQVLGIEVNLHLSGGRNRRKASNRSLPVHTLEFEEGFTKRIHGWEGKAFVLMESRDRSKVILLEVDPVSLQITRRLDLPDAAKPDSISNSFAWATITSDGYYLLGPNPRMSIDLYSFEVAPLKDSTAQTHQIMDLSPDGTWFVESLHGVMRVRSTDSGEVLLASACHENSYCWRKLAISPDSQWLATSEVDGTLLIWPIPQETYNE